MKQSQTEEQNLYIPTIMISSLAGTAEPNIRPERLSQQQSTPTADRQELG